MGAHPISVRQGLLAQSLMLVFIGYSVFLTSCGSEELAALNPSIAVCRVSSAEACGESFELGAISAGSVQTRSLDIRNVGSGYLNVHRVSMVDATGTILEFPQSLSASQAGLLSFNLEIVPGMQRLTLVVESNDPSTPQLTVELLYHGVRSELLACPLVGTEIDEDNCSPELNLSLHGVRRAEASEMTVAIMNRGTASFMLGRSKVDTEESTPGEWQVLTSTTPGEMPAERTYLVTFSYRPADEISDRLILQLFEDGQLEPAVAVTLVADSFPNAPPVASAVVWDSELNEAVVTMGEELWLDASGSHDPEGDELTFSWTLESAPAGSVATLSHPQAALTALSFDKRGNYLMQVVVQDSLGLADTAQIQVQVRSVYALEIQASWPLGMGDIDLHLVPIGEELFSEQDCHFHNGTVNWGELDSTHDDPFLMYDTQGIENGDESIVIESPAHGVYAIYLNYFEAYTTSAIPVAVTIWGDDGETQLGAQTAALAQTCDTVLVGRVSWPGGIFEPGDPVSYSQCFAGGTP